MENNSFFLFFISFNLTYEYRFVHQNGHKKTAGTQGDFIHLLHLLNRTPSCYGLKLRFNLSLRSALRAALADRLKKKV